MTPRQYDLFLTGTQKFAVWAPLLIFAIFPVFFWLMFNEARFDAGPAEAPFFRFVPLLFLVILFGIYAVTTLNLPYRISVTRDRQLVFKWNRCWRCKGVNANEQSVRVAADEYGMHRRSNC